MADVMISTENLTKFYNGKAVVNNVSLTIERGAIVGLVGQNGAGKTTLIRILTGLVKPSSGSFRLLPDAQRAGTDVAAIVERPSIYNSMSAIDNLVAQSHLLDIPVDMTYLEKTLRLVGLEPSLKRAVKNYSLGMKQRLAIAMTLVGRPQLLILDEPTNGLDPQGIADMREIFVNLNKEMGVTILVSSHILSELGKFATEFYIMDRGLLLKRVTAQELSSLSGSHSRLTVDNAAKAAAALKDAGQTEILSETVLSLTTDLPVTEIMLKLSQADVTVANFTQTGDALEDYYLQIVRASHNGGLV